MDEKFIGIDVGGTNVKFGIVTSKGELLEKIKFPSREMAEKGFLNEFSKELGNLLEANPDIKKVGIGVPGMLSKDRRTLVELANIPELNGLKLIDKLEEKFPGIAFRMENDANAAALGEYHFSEEPMPEDLLFITLGTGVGGAAIIDGKIFPGADGNGLEIGHILLDPEHTLEDYVGKRGIVATAQRLIYHDHRDTILLSKYEGNFDAKKIEKAAKKGDKLAQKVYKKVGKRLGYGMVSALRIFDVGTILIGGGVSDVFPLMEEPMWDSIKEYLSEYYTDKLTIKVASLKNEAGIVGAASLCF